MGPTWPFLLMYGSHDMRHTGFRRLTVVNGTPGTGASHIFILKLSPLPIVFSHMGFHINLVFIYLFHISLLCHFISMVFFYGDNLGF